MTWIASNDDTQVLCCCEYSKAHDDLFQHAKSLATDLLEVEGGVADYLVSFDDKAAVWPQNLVDLLKDGGDVVLARLSTGVALGMSAIERVCDLALVISASVAGFLKHDRQEMEAALWDVIDSADVRFPGRPVPWCADPSPAKARMKKATALLPVEPIAAGLFQLPGSRAITKPNV